MTVDTQKLRELLEKATPGPWRWEFNQEHRSVHLVGGKPQYDLTVMDFTRWGMSGAGIRLRELSQGGMDLMHKLHDRPDWIEPFPGRAHHKHWCAAVSHPDMQLMTDAVSALPALLDEIDRLRAELQARQWQPIETCPRQHGRHYLICKDCGPGTLPSISIGYCFDDQKGWHLMESNCTAEQYGYRVTHFMPLPPAPPQGKKDAT